MKNKGLIGLIIVLAGLLAAVYFGSKNSSSTIKKQLSNFAIEDTASITKVFLSDKSSNNVLLERIDGDNWTVNKDYRARQDVVVNLLKTIKELTVRAPVSKSRFDYTVKQLASNSTKVEIYQNNSEKPTKVYYVGGANQDNTGTYMLLENSSVPFLMHIEGHYGFVHTRYSPRINDWRDNTIWYFPGEKVTTIKNVKVEYPKDQNKSFEITKSAENSYTLKNSKSEVVPVPNNQVIYDYLRRFRKISYEGFEETKSEAYCDSIIKNTPVETIWTIEEDNGRTTEVKAYLKPVKDDAEDWEGNEIPHDLERMYATINNQEFVIIQYFVFDPLTLTLQDFLPPS